MRFLFVDRLTRLEGQEVEGIATFSIAHESLRDHYARQPVVPGPLLIEAIAQNLADHRSSSETSAYEDAKPGVAGQISYHLQTDIMHL